MEKPKDGNGLDLDRLEALEKATTPGPWNANQYCPTQDSLYITDGTCNLADDVDPCDAAFIAALRNAAPALFAAVRERDELRAMNKLLSAAPAIVAAEREACARIAEHVYAKSHVAETNAAKHIAAAIRARKD